MLFVFFSMIISVGIVAVIKRTNILVLSIISVLAILLYGKFMVTLLFNVPFTQGGAWQAGMREILETVNKHDDDYTTVIIETPTAQPHIFTLFYTRYEPKKYHQDINNMGGIPIPRKSFNFGKYVFRPVLWREDKYLNDVLLVSPISSLSEDKVIEEVELYETIYDQFENPIAKIVGIK